VIVPGLLSSLGSRGFTTLTNFTNFLACMVWGGIPLGARMWCGKRRLFWEPFRSDNDRFYQTRLGTNTM
jgi:hypothetical protein